MLLFKQYLVVLALVTAISGLAYTALYIRKKTDEWGYNHQIKKDSNYLNKCLTNSKTMREDIECIKKALKN